MFRFILQCADDVYSQQEKDEAKGRLMDAIREQSNGGGVDENVEI